ncbi:MAG: hypothetical protein VW378_02625 [bacterium]
MRSVTASGPTKVSRLDVMELANDINKIIEAAKAFGDQNLEKLCLAIITEDIKSVETELSKQEWPPAICNKLWYCTKNSKIAEALSKAILHSKYFGACYLMEDVVNTLERNGIVSKSSRLASLKNEILSLGENDEAFSQLIEQVKKMNLTKDNIEEMKKETNKNNKVKLELFFAQLEKITEEEARSRIKKAEKKRTKRNRQKGRKKERYNQLRNNVNAWLDNIANIAEIGGEVRATLIREHFGDEASNVPENYTDTHMKQLETLWKEKQRGCSLKIVQEVKTVLTPYVRLDSSEQIKGFKARLEEEICVKDQSIKKANELLMELEAQGGYLCPNDYHNKYTVTKNQEDDGMPQGNIAQHLYALACKNDPQTSNQRRLEEPAQIADYLNSLERIGYWKQLRHNLTDINKLGITETQKERLKVVAYALNVLSDCLFSLERC